MFITQLLRCCFLLLCLHTPLWVTSAGISVFNVSTMLATIAIAPICLTALLAVSLGMGQNLTGTQDLDEVIVLPQPVYWGCIRLSWLDPLKVIVFPLRQTELETPGPIACSIKCLLLDTSYSIVLVHLPAKGPLTNWFVCGCAKPEVLDDDQGDTATVLDSSCHLPCPQGGSHVVDAIQLVAQRLNQYRKIEEKAEDGTSTSAPEEEEETLWLPTGGGRPQTDDKKLFFSSVKHGAGDGVGKRRKNSRPQVPPGHQSCGNGRGLLSVYRVGGSNFAKRISPLFIVNILSILFLL